MKPIKLIYNYMLEWWEEKLKDENFVKGIICIVASILIFIITFVVVSIPSSAATDPVDPVGPVFPSDLTGYTVTVPAGWTATAGQAIYDISGSIYTDYYYSNDFSTLYIGYNLNYDTFTHQPSSNTLSFGDYYVTISYGDKFVLSNLTGNDVDDLTLIEWLISNNATFTLNNESEGFIIPTGTYYLQNPSNNLRGTISFDYSFSTLDGTSYNSVFFAQYSNTNLVDIQYNENSIYNGYYGFSDVTNSVILIHEPETLTSEEATLFNEAFIRVDSDNKLINLFNAALEYGYNSGNTVGYNTGYNTGYEEGFAIGVENSGGNFFGNFIESILNALDKLVILPGGISILDLIKAIGGIFVVVWLLKLLAGG